MGVAGLPFRACGAALALAWLLVFGAASAQVPWDEVHQRLEDDFEREASLMASGDPWGMASLEEARESWMAQWEGHVVDELRGLPSPWDLSATLLRLVALDPNEWLDRLARPEVRSASKMWDPAGRLAVPLALWLLGEGRVDDARTCLQKKAVPREDRSRRDVLLVESLDALGDSLTAGTVALRTANAQPRHDFWADLALRGGLHLLRMGQPAGAWQLLERRSRRAPENIRTLWLRWRILRQDPGLASETARREILADLSGEALNSHQVDVLSAELEAWIDGGWVPPLEHSVDLAGLLVRGDRLSAWRKLLAGSAVSSPPKAAAIVAWAVGSWRRSGRADLALSVADSFLSSAAADSQRVLLERARLHRRRGDLDAMTRDARAVWRASRDPELAGLALWELAREVEDERGSGPALPLYRSLTGRPDCGSWAVRAAQRVGVLRIELGQYQESVAWWDSLGFGGPRVTSVPLPHLDVDPEALAAGWYWKGRALDALGLEAQAVEAWEKTSNLQSPNYYSWLSEKALEAGSAADLWKHVESEIHPWKEGKGRGAPSGGGEERLPAGSMETVLRCRIWTELGRGAWTRMEWEEAGWDTLQRSARVLLHRACGETSRSLRAAFRLPDAQQRERFSHPAPFAKTLLDEARRRQISPFLLWAIMRQESAMDARAVSRAGAVGLMQVMPATAREVGKRWGLPSGPLTSASTNIALGAAHFAEILDKPLAVPEALAGYNAGLDPVRRWQGRSPSLDLFVEKIGYSETRNYVRRVLRDYGIYRNLYGSSPQDGGRRGEP